MSTTKTCTRCLEVKPLTQFGARTQNGKTYPTTRCRKCKRIVEKEKGWINEDTNNKIEERRALKRKTERALGERTDLYILYDSRRSDRKKGFDNDLDREFIAQEIAKGCAYCGETAIRMVLDRIDNKIGHIKTNVNPSCCRCNHIRGDMPSEAWQHFSSALRIARETGSFGDWRSRPWSKND